MVENISRLTLPLYPVKKKRIFDKQFTFVMSNMSLYFECLVSNNPPAGNVSGLMSFKTILPKHQHSFGPTVNLYSINRSLFEIFLLDPLIFAFLTSLLSEYFQQQIRRAFQMLTIDTQCFLVQVSFIKTS